MRIVNWRGTAIGRRAVARLRTFQIELYIDFNLIKLFTLCVSFQMHSPLKYFKYSYLDSFAKVRLYSNRLLAMDYKCYKGTKAS
jgi:hypothetical protein